MGPSRARRQLAARLAAQKQAAENGENEGGNKEQGNDSNENSNSQWSNPFVIAGLDDDGNNEEQGAAFPSADFKDEPFSSPTFPDAHFSPPDSLSTNSSDDDRFEGTRRNDRAPLEVEDDDDEMGEMVGPSVGASMMTDSDEEDEAIINESLGYPNLGANRYKDFRQSRIGTSPFGSDEQNDSSDGEDEGLVEILVPGGKSSTSSS